MINKLLLRTTTALCLLILGSISHVAAIPAYPKPITVTQSDGTKLTIHISGDEFNHRILSQEGYTLVGGANNDYYYATLSTEGQLMAGPVKARPMNSLSSGERAKVAALPKGLRATAAPKLRMPSTKISSKNILLSSTSSFTAPERISSTKTTGTLRSLIILVQFSDTKFTVPAIQQAVTNMLNTEGYNLNGATGSARDYYIENSNTLFDPEFVVAGPYTISKTARYYAGSDGIENADKMVVEACKLADADVNFSEYAESGVIRDIFIFYAGYNQAEGAANTIWPHRGNVRDWQVNQSFDGVRLEGYACSSEYNGTTDKTLTSIGTFCHEFGHVLGWPDFYDTDYEGSGGRASAIENYSLMCEGAYNNNGHTPPALNILERWMMGWAAPQVFTNSGEFELGSVCDNKGYILPLRSSTNEYFLAEFRGTNKTVWDNPAHIGGSGMMVYHVDYSSNYAKYWGGNYNSLNTNPRHECMKLLRSASSANFKPGRTFFPGENGVNKINSENITAYTGWTGLSTIISVDNIVIDGDVIRLSVTRSGGPEIFFKAETYQTDAIISWIDDTAKSWPVTWSLGSKQLGSKTVDQPTLRLENLRPATNYKVTISGTSNNEPWSQTYTITTGSTSSNTPRLGISKSEYAVNEPILLTLVDYRGTYKELRWLVDGQSVTSTHLTLPQGEHRITAVIVSNSNTKEYITKYITVK